MVIRQLIFKYRTLVIIIMKIERDGDTRCQASVREVQRVLNGKYSVDENTVSGNITMILTLHFFRFNRCTSGVTFKPNMITLFINGIVTVFYKKYVYVLLFADHLKLFKRIKNFR